jgi:hypothetical protein
MRIRDVLVLCAIGAVGLAVTFGLSSGSVHAAHDATTTGPAIPITEAASTAKQCPPTYGLSPDGGTPYGIGMDCDGGMPGGGGGIGGDGGLYR